MKLTKVWVLQILFFFFWIVLIIQDVLKFHTSFRISLFISTKRAVGILRVIALNLYRFAVLTVLLVSIHEHRMFSSLFRSSVHSAVFYNFHCIHVWTVQAHLYIFGLYFPLNTYYQPYMDFPGSSAVKNLPANAGIAGSISGSGRSPGEGNGNPLQYSCLGNPMDRGAWWPTVHGVAESDRTWQLNNNTTWSVVVWIYETSDIGDQKTNSKVILGYFCNCFLNFIFKLSIAI